MNCSCSTRLVDVGDPGTAPKCLSFCPCAFVLGIFRLVLRCRDVVLYFAASSGSVFAWKTPAVDEVQVPPFGDGTVRPSHFGVADFDTFRHGLLEVMLCLAALLLRPALSVDVTSRIWKSYLELCESLDVSETFLERSFAPQAQNSVPSTLSILL